VTKRSRLTRVVGVLALLAALAFLAGCGGGGNKSSSGSSGGSSNSGKTYPVLRVIWDAPDYMDPQLYYTVAAYQINNYVWSGLLGYKHAAGPAGAQLVPYLAESMPKISADGKDLKFTLRKNLHYSNGAAVKASDFKYSIERAFKMDSPGVGFFSAISGVSGANGFATTKKGHITGITANDQTGQITIKLTQPQGDFQNILATTFAAPVPASTPAKDQSPHPAPSTGPHYAAPPPQCPSMRT